MSAEAVPNFADKVAIVTGSSAGIGYEIAKVFAEAGAKVVLNSRAAERAQQAAASLQAGGATAIGVAADVTDPAQAQRLVDQAVAAFGGVDILVNNAGISMIASAEALDPAEWQRAINTNLSGPFYCARAVAPALFARGGGVILNVGSAAGAVGLPMRAAYCAAKHGLEGLTKVLALDWAKRGVRVICIDPAYIKTAMDERDSATAGYTDAQIERRTPLGRFGSVAEVAKVALFLASPAASYITGSSILVDGGWVAYGYL